MSSCRYSTNSASTASRSPATQWAVRSRSSRRHEAIESARCSRSTSRVTGLMPTPSLPSAPGRVAAGGARSRCSRRPTRADAAAGDPRGGRARAPRPALARAGCGRMAIPLGPAGARHGARRSLWVPLRRPLHALAGGLRNARAFACRRRDPNRCARSIVRCDLRLRRDPPDAGMAGSSRVLGPSSTYTMAFPASRSISSRVSGPTSNLQCDRRHRPHLHIVHTIIAVPFPAWCAA
jgi:hypothetical protein